MFRIMWCVAVAAAVMVVAPAEASDAPKIRGARTVSAQQAYEALSTGAVILDLRDSSRHHEARLPGAHPALVAYDRTSGRFDPAIFGADTNATIIVYHDGPAGVIAYRAIRSATEAGFANVLWLRGGLREWVGRGHPVEGTGLARHAAVLETDR